MIGFARAGSLVFWKCVADPGEPEPDRPRHDAVGLCVTVALVAAPALLAFFAGPAMNVMEATATPAVRARSLHRRRPRQRGRPRASAAVTWRFLPHPRLALFVALIWLALVNEVTVGSVVMGLVLGLVLPLVTGPFWPDAPRLGRPRMILEYFAVVAWDIVLANLQVARLILLVPRDRLRSAFVTVPARSRPRPRRSRCSPARSP